MTNRRNKTGSLEGVNAKNLFPGLLEDEQKKKKLKSGVAPPPPPDTDWLDNGYTGEEPDQSDYLVSALVVFPTGAETEKVKEILAGMGYLVEMAHSSEQALERLTASRYSLVISVDTLAAEGLHEFICKFPSSMRREMYYVLVGQRLHTLFDLQALSLSVNLVVNSGDVKYLKAILKKGFEDYEKLFRPLIETINSTSGSLL